MIALTGQEVIRNLLSFPNAPILIQEAERKLSEERKRRLDFYDTVTDEHKVEFVNGEVIIHSPVKKEHNDANGALFRLLSTYVQKHHLGYVGIEKVMIALSRNDYEPDLCFFGNEKADTFKEGQSLFPAPDLVVEILSKGTVKNDRGVKFEDYQAHNVLEYWLIHPTKKTVEQYQLNKNKMYELILKSNQGTIEAKAIKGFKIPIEAIFDNSENMKALAKIIEG